MKLETRGAREERLQTFMDGVLTLARSLSSHMRFELGINVSFQLGRDQQATAVMRRTIFRITEPIHKFLASNLSAMLIQSREACIRAGLEEMENKHTTTEDDMEDDYNVIKEVCTHLLTIVDSITFKLWNKVDNRCQEFEQEVKLWIIMQNISINEATNATVKVLQNNKHKKNNNAVRKIVQEETMREVRNIDKAKKRSEKRTYQKNVWQRTEGQPSTPCPMAQLETTKEDPTENQMV